MRVPMREVRGVKLFDGLLDREAQAAMAADIRALVRWSRARRSCARSRGAAGSSRCG